MSVPTTLTVEQLAEYEWVEDLVTDVQAYRHWYRTIQPIYLKLLEQHKHFYYREYQLSAAAIIPLAKRHIFAFSMSLGKTLITLLAIKVLYNLDQVAQVHIVVPNVLAAHRWLEEVERFNLQAELITTEKQLLRTSKPIIIYTHDFPRCKASSLKTTRNTISRLLKRKYRPSMVVVDEIHHLGDSTLRYQHLVQVWRSAKRGVALSGTLSDHQLTKLQSVLSFVYGGDWPFTERQFTTHFCARKEFAFKYADTAKPKFLQHLRSDRIPEYYDLMRRFTYRLTINEVKDSLVIPTINLMTVAVEPLPEHHHQYHKYLQDNRVIWSSGTVSETTALQLMHPLIRLTNAPDGTSAKITALLDHLVPKTIVFCSYRESMAYVINHLKHTKLVTITSELTNDQRLEQLHLFQIDPDVMVGVFSLNLASESIDVTQAKRLIFYCTGWSSLKIEQAVCRAVRPGNPNQVVDIVYIYHQGMVDQYQYELINAKRKLASQILDYEFEDTSVTDIKPSQVLKKISEEPIPF